MAVKDNISDLSIRQAMEVGAIGANGTTNGEIIDTADFDLGIGFAINVTNFTDGVFTLQVEESETGAFGGEESVVPASKYVGQSIPSADAAVAAGESQAKGGVFGTKRYVRASIVATSVTTGATVGVTAILSAELVPTV